MYRTKKVEQGPLSEMLADDFIFEKSDRTQDGKESILIRMATDDSFTVSDWVI